MTTRTNRYEIASCSDARKYGEILARLVKFARKEGRGQHEIFENMSESTARDTSTPSGSAQGSSSPPCRSPRDGTPRRP